MAGFALVVVAAFAEVAGFLAFVFLVSGLAVFLLGASPTWSFNFSGAAFLALVAFLAAFFVGAPEVSESGASAGRETVEDVLPLVDDLGAGS